MKKKGYILLSVICAVVLIATGIILGVVMKKQSNKKTYTASIKTAEKYLEAGDYTQAVVAYKTAIEKMPEKEKKDTIRKTCQRVFQALRIDVNREFEVLYEFMEKLPDALKPGGRVAILTFHSGEDKLVKKALKAGYKAGIYSDYAKDVIRPSAQECAQNGRARSTKMRWAIKAE